MNTAEVHHQRPRERAKPAREGAGEVDASVMQGQACGSDVRWFSQLLETPPLATALGCASGLESGAMGALLEQLTPRLQDAAHTSLQALLYLPQLGRVSVSARHLPGESWEIGLHADEQDAQDYLAARASGCQAALAEALGQTVVLQVNPEEPWA